MTISYSGFKVIRKNTNQVIFSKRIYHANANSKLCQCYFPFSFFSRQNKRMVRIKGDTCDLPIKPGNQRPDDFVMKHHETFSQD